MHTFSMREPVICLLNLSGVMCANRIRCDQSSVSFHSPSDHSGTGTSIVHSPAADERRRVVRRRQNHRESSTGKSEFHVDQRERRRYPGCDRVFRYVALSRMYGNCWIGEYLLEGESRDAK
jgi:hypothetical protein